MNTFQRSVIQKHFTQLYNEIDVHEILQLLHTIQILTDNNVQIIKTEQTDNAKSVKLFK